MNVSFTTGFIGAGGRTRTGTLSPAVDFESTTSTNSITPANAIVDAPLVYTIFSKIASKIFTAFFQPPTATPALNPTWSKYDAYDITKTNATITATVHYGKKLKAGTTYYYQFYLVVNGVEYKSAVKSFTTAK